jgi:predicted DNA-binding protein
VIGMSASVKSDKDMETKIWVKIPKKTGNWKGINAGDELIGTYLKKLPDSFRGQPKTKYCFETEHPQAVDGKIIVYGTEGINNQLDDELVGCKLKITYQGTQPTADPKKRPFKIYDIEAFIAPSHPKFKEYTEDLGDVEEPSEIPKENPLAGDENAMRCIDELTEDLLAENTEPTEAKILEKAKEYHIEKLEMYTNKDILVRIEKELKRRG